MNVVLLHGQGRTTYAMRLLGMRLKRLGYRVYYFRYYTWREKFETIVSRLAKFLNTFSHNEPCSVVAHSLGGLLVRASLPLLGENIPDHLIMLAPPNQPPRLAKKMHRNLLYRLFTFDCGQRLARADFYDSLPVPVVPVTIIAGTAGPRGGFSPFGNEPNDSVLSVSETRLYPGQKVIEVPSLHTFIMNSKVVLFYIDSILKA